MTRKDILEKYLIPIIEVIPLSSEASLDSFIDQFEASEFDGFSWDYAKLPGRPEGRKSAWPFAVALDAVLATAKENLLAGREAADVPLGKRPANVGEVAAALKYRYADFSHYNLKDSLDELLFIICSTKTSEANYRASFEALKMAFPTPN